MYFKDIKWLKSTIQVITQPNCFVKFTMYLKKTLFIKAHYGNNNELFEKDNIITKRITDLNSPALLYAQKAVFVKI